MAYLVDNWDDEDIQEIRKLLNKPASGSLTEGGQQRHLLKKILSQVTRGLDMSSLFTDIVKLCASVDIVEKKLAYLYMTTYVRQKPDLTLLAVNTIQKDCKDSNPMVRGLALKTLCSLRLAELLEYTRGPLLSGLRDQSAYVRRTAVIGCLKLYQMSPESLSDDDIINTLYEMLRDGDVIVVTNCLLALEEMLQAEGGVAINQRIAHYLLNRLAEFTEWGQCCVLQLLLKYRPLNEEETFDMMNVVDRYLKHTNSGVCMAAIRFMLHLSQDLPDISQDVYKRLKCPLVSLLSSDRPELVYASLCHLQWLNGRAPGKLDKHYKKFYCRYNDPSYVKYKKVELLASLCCEESLKDIVEELSVYATDVSVQLSRLAVSALGGLAKHRPAFARPCLDALLGLLTMQSDAVSSQVLVVFQEILRYEHLADFVPEVVDRLPSCEGVVQEPSGKEALVWLIAEHGQRLPTAPYIIEAMVDSVEEEPDTGVRRSLLSATVKLFLARPAECQDMLGKLLEHCIECESCPDLREKALVYYRLLSTDVHKAKEVICTAPPRLPVPNPQETLSALIDLKHFNSLALLFGPRKWQEIQDSDVRSEGEEWTAQRGLTASPDGCPPGARPDGEERAAPETGRLLDLDGGSPAGAGSGVGSEVTPGVTPEVDVAEVGLASAVSLSPADFESKWTSWPSREARDLHLQGKLSPSEVSHRMEALGCKTMATTPEDADPWRAYLYAQETSSDQLFLIEVNLLPQNGLLTFDLRCEGGQPSQQPSHVAAKVANLITDTLS